MKKLAKATLALAMGLLMLLGSAIAAPDALTATRTETGKFADQWEYKVDEESGVGYYMLDAVYCEKPVLAEVQHLVIYAPAAYMTQNEDGTVVVNKDGKVISSTGAVYTAENAPLLLHNTSGGYSSSTIQPVDITYLNEGYIHVTIATRGKETKSVVNEYTGIYDRDAMEATKDAEGEYIGQFPALIVDMKAGIRFLKYFDAELPGNSNRIISRGFSSGGAVSAMLGASGNSAIFAPYLEEIGAYDATDDIFITLASAPITNLSSADASYEWYQYANETYFLFNAMAYDRLGNQLEDFPVGPKNKYPLGSNVLGGAHEDELSALLYDWFVDYVQSLGLDLGDDGRSGQFYDGFAEIYADALEEYIARYDELKTEKQPATVEEYLDSLGEGWFTYDAATGEVTIASLDALIVNHVARKKMCPSLDAYNYKSNENDAFTSADGTTLHFSPTVRDALKILMDDADGIYNWSEEELQYITDLYNDYAAGVTEEAAEMLEVMSPVNYVVDKEGYEADISPYWRIRIGSEDGDHGAPAGWLIAEGLEKYHPEVEVSMGIAWGMGHSLSELTEQDMYDYISEIMVSEDGLKVLKASFTDVSSAQAAYFEAAEYVNAAGMMTGVAPGKFAPTGYVTAGTLMTVLARMDGVDTTGAVWYEKGAAWAAENGISTADPAAVMTREEIVTMLWEFAKYKGYDVSVGEDTNILSYGDATQISESAISAMQWACGSGLVKGDGVNLYPAQNVTRQEMAVMLMRFCENAK